MRHLLAAILLIPLFALTVGGEDQPEEKAEPPVKTLRITLLPDDRREVLKEKYQALADYLESATDYEFEYVAAENYAAVVSGIALGKTDIAFLGGVLLVQADRQSEGEIEVLCCRDLDAKFQSVLIARATDEEEQPEPWEDLKKLAEEGKGKSLAFGSKGSMSGHIVPRYYIMEDTEKSPEDIFDSVVYTGSHSRVLTQVADESVDFGMLNLTVFQTAEEETRSKLRIVYRTPEYHDYAFAIRKDVGSQTIKDVRKAMLALDAENEEHKKVLDQFYAGKFIEADLEEDWKAVREVMDSGIDFGG